MLNRSIMVGRVSAEPKVKYLKDERPITTFSLIINTDKKRKEVVNCVAFDGLAKICGEYIHKGRLVAVEGKLQMGKKALEIVIDEMQILDSKMEVE